MSENPTQPSSEVKLTITFDRLSGAFKVTGPTDDMFTSFALLELAKLAVIRKNEKSLTRNLIELPNMRNPL